MLSGFLSLKKTYAAHIFGSFVRTFDMFLGDLSFDDMQVKIHDQSKSGGHTKSGGPTELALAQTVYVVFLFLFNIVFMNLLNAVAIDDIQVLVTIDLLCVTCMRKVVINLLFDSHFPDS